MHLTSSPIDWYAARAGGVVAYVLLTCTVLLGLTMASRRRLPAWPRVALEDVHRYAGLLTGTFIGIHVVTIAIDSYLPFSLSSLVVPFTARYRPTWTGLGIVATELLVALAVTNRLRARGISQRAWRRAHYLNFVVWGGATLHGLGSGTDRSAAWLVAIEAVAVGAVVAVTGWRVLHSRVRGPGLALGLPAALGGGAALAAIALSSGPLRFHPKPWNAARFSEPLAGRIQRQTGKTRGLVSLTGTGSGKQHVLVRADLLIAPGKLLSTAFALEYLPSAVTCRGHVTRVDTDGLGFQAHCSLGRGKVRHIRARWANSPGAELQDGTITST